MRLIDADALLKTLTVFDEKYTLQKSDVFHHIENAPTVQREGWVSDKDTLALDAARKIMLDVNATTIPVDVKRMPQLQAKIQVVITELLQAAPTDTE